MKLEHLVCRLVFALLLVFVSSIAVANNEGGTNIGRITRPRTSMMDTPRNEQPTTIYAKLIHRDMVVRPTFKKDDDNDDDDDDGYGVIGDVQSHAYPLWRTGLFFVNISIGSPPQTQILVMDTWSSMTVVRQYGCVGCETVEVPLYKPTDSSTFKNLTCASEFCTGLGTGCDSFERCTFKVTYGDGSQTTAVLTSETFGFITYKEGLVDAGKVLFGCTNNLSWKKKLDGANGVLGLGPKVISLARRFYRFSYCIGSLNDRLYDYNILVLGEQAIIDPVTSTPMISSGQYYVTLEAISVGSNRLDILPQGLKAIMDTGSTISYLTREVYDTLTKEIKNVVKGVLPLVSDAPRLCYEGELKRDFENFPLVTLHFMDGANLVLEPPSLFEQNSGGMVCLAVRTNTTLLGDFALIGMLAQQNYNIGYDLLGEKLTMTRMDCRALMD